MTMSRWYQHVFSGQQVEVKTLDEDDQYAGVSVWSRIAAPPEAVKPEPLAAPEPVKKAAPKKKA